MIKKFSIQVNGAKEIIENENDGNGRKITDCYNYNYNIQHNIFMVSDNANNDNCIVENAVDTNNTNNTIIMIHDDDDWGKEKE